MATSWVADKVVRARIRMSTATRHGAMLENGSANSTPAMPSMQAKIQPRRSP